MSDNTRERLLDVSDLEPPEPLQLVLQALDELEHGEYLHMLHRREPLLLYPELEQRGFRYANIPGGSHACELLIWRDGDAAAEHACLSRQGEPRR